MDSLLSVVTVKTISKDASVPRQIKELSPGQQFPKLQDILKRLSTRKNNPVVRWNGKVAVQVGDEWISIQTARRKVDPKNLNRPPLTRKYLVDHLVNTRQESEFEELVCHFKNQPEDTPYFPVSSLTQLDQEEETPQPSVNQSQLSQVTLDLNDDVPCSPVTTISNKRGRSSSPTNSNESDLEDQVSSLQKKPRLNVSVSAEEDSSIPESLVIDLESDEPFFNLNLSNEALEAMIQAPAWLAPCQAQVLVQELLNTRRERELSKQHADRMTRNVSVLLDILAKDWTKPTASSDE